MYILSLNRNSPVVGRDDMLIMVDHSRLSLEPKEAPQHLKVRFRTLGCYPLTGAIARTPTQQLFKSANGAIGKGFVKKHAAA